MTHQMLVLLVLVFTISCFSLEFDRILTSNMVFQRNVNTNFVFGTSTGNQVKVTVGGKSVEGKVEGGKFRVQLPNFPAGGPHTIEVTELPSQKKISLGNILFGDVFFCSGQSNMAWPISRTWEFQTVVRESQKYPNIRFLVHNANAKPQWRVTSQETTAGNSAVCYFFALELYKKLKIPIGTISSSVGGTPIEFWMTAESASACKSSRPGGSLYTSMLVPFKDITIRAFHWYQGESVNELFHL
jgi:sialate O-acetylesterase